MNEPVDRPIDEIIILCNSPLNEIGPCNLDKNVLVFQTSNGCETIEPIVAPIRLATGELKVLCCFCNKCIDKREVVKIKLRV